jgi:signal transduction histidine kinase
MLFTWFTSYILNGGIKLTDSVARARAIRISNLIALLAIVNTLIFGTIFYFLNDAILLTVAMIVGVIYAICLACSLLGAPTLGRVMLLLSGNAIVFYFACLFRGESYLQLMFYSLTASAFMHFSWEERRYYFLTIIPFVLLVIGEYLNWGLFTAHSHNYDIRILRMFSLVAPLHQIIAAFYYFLKQSVRFETESIENLKKVEIEHQKQLQVQKMSSLGEMAGGVSHEINNPLMVIIGKTHQIKRELRGTLPDEDKTFVHLEKIDAMVHRISKIIRALRNFSRNSQHDSSERVSFENILELTLDLCRERFASNGITLTIKCQPEIFLICRPTEISQVLLNLLNNAFDACSNGREAEVSIIASINEEYVTIKITDNGPGIKPENINKIMQPFFTTKDIGKGTGLGLSISKGLIEAHDGSLTYLPDPHHTIFQIILPAH